MKELRKNIHEKNKRLYTALCFAMSMSYITEKRASIANSYTQNTQKYCASQIFSSFFLFRFCIFRAVVSSAFVFEIVSFNRGKRRSEIERKRQFWHLKIFHEIQQQSE